MSKRTRQGARRGRRAAAVDPCSVVLFTDGATLLKNPRHSGGGWVIRHWGKIVSEGGHYIGIGTCHEGEYAGMIAGLEAALELGIDRIEVYSDSEVVVGQVNGHCRCRKRLRKFRDEVWALLSRFKSWSLDWVPREMNAEADTLAKAAVRARRNVGVAA